MVTALPSTTKSHHSILPNRPIFRNSNADAIAISTKPNSKRNGKMRTTASLSDSSRPFSKDGILRRGLMFMGLPSSVALILPALGRNLENRSVIHLLHHYPISPPNPLFLKSKDKSTWSAKDVADSLLADKSALRVTTTQRMDESSVIDAHSSTVDGVPYWYYEYLVRKSPTKTAQESNLYRRSVASTCERDGYLYTLNASTLSKQWEKMGPVLEKTVVSFRLLPIMFLLTRIPGDFGDCSSFSHLLRVL